MFDTVPILRRLRGRRRDIPPRAGRAITIGARLASFAGASRSGSAAVEFALIVGPLLLFIIGILNVALYFFAAQALDQGTRLAARRILTGDVMAQGLTAAKFKTDVLCPALTFPLPCADITVSVSRVAAKSSASLKTGIYAFIDPTLPDLFPPNLSVDKGAFCTGVPGDYVFVDVAYKHPLFAVLGDLIFGPNNPGKAIVLRATYFLTNEPFAAGTPQASC